MNSANFESWGNERSHYTQSSKWYCKKKPSSQWAPAPSGSGGQASQTKLSTPGSARSPPGEAPAPRDGPVPSSPPPPEQFNLFDTLTYSMYIIICVFDMICCSLSFIECSSASSNGGYWKCSKCSLHCTFALLLLKVISSLTAFACWFYSKRWMNTVVSGSRSAPV